MHSLFKKKISWQKLIQIEFILELMYQSMKYNDNEIHFMPTKIVCYLFANIFEVICSHIFKKYNESFKDTTV